VSYNPIRDSYGGGDVEEFFERCAGALDVGVEGGLVFRVVADRGASGELRVAAGERHGVGADCVGIEVEMDGRRFDGLLPIGRRCFEVGDVQAAVEHGTIDGAVDGEVAVNGAFHRESWSGGESEQRADVGEFGERALQLVRFQVNDGGGALKVRVAGESE